MKRLLASRKSTACAAFIVVILYAVTLDSMVVTDYGWQVLRRRVFEPASWKLLLALWLGLSLPATAVTLGLLRRDRAA